MSHDNDNDNDDDNPYDNKYTRRRARESREIDVNKAKGNKCPRCWKILETSCIRCSELF